MKKLAIIVCVLCLPISMVTGCANFSASSNSEKSTIEESTAEESTTVSEAVTPQEGIDYEISYIKILLSDYFNSYYCRAKILIEVTNMGTENLKLSSHDSNYFYIVDASGVQINDSPYYLSSTTYPEVLQPGRSCFMTYDTNLPDINKDAELTIVPYLSMERTTEDCIRFDLSDVTTSMSIDEITVTGFVENTTGADVSGSIEVVSVFYDANDDPIGLAHETLSGSLLAGYKKEFEMSYSDYYFQNTKGYKTFAYLK